MQKITFLHRVTNFSKSGRNNKSGLGGYLNHDLRQALSAEKRLGFDDTQTANNLIWYRDKRPMPFSRLNPERKEALHRAIALPMQEAGPSNSNLSAAIHKLQKALSKIRNNFKGYKTDDTRERKFWDELAQLDATAEDAAKAQAIWKEEFQGAKRFAQKNKQITNYTSKLKELADMQEGVENSQGLNLATRVQAQLHKIPLANGIGHDQISIQDFNDYLRDFYDRCLPDYPIIATVGHVDERSTDPEHNESGDHLHSYIDARNARTGKLDLLDAQLAWSESALDEAFVTNARKYRDDQINDIKRRKLHTATEAYHINKAEGQYRGRLYQEAVRRDINEHLFKPKGLEVEYKYETRAKRALVTDSRKPQDQRKFNRVSHEIEVTKRLKAENSLLLNRRKTLKGDMLLQSAKLDEFIEKQMTYFAELLSGTPDLSFESILTAFDEVPESMQEPAIKHTQEHVEEIQGALTQEQSKTTDFFMSSLRARVNETQKVESNIPKQVERETIKLK